jgi:hypothetical protein
MVQEQRLAPEVEQLWRDFHRLVNMSSEQLRSWLLTEGSGPDAFGDDPDLDVPVPGRHILAVLRKRKVDLTTGDIDVMRQTVDRVRELLDDRPAGGLSDHDWRRALMSLGHDPLRAG